MGCCSSKAMAAAVEARRVKEETVLGPPTKVMDASEHSQYLVMMVRKSIEVQLSVLKLPNLKATQMICRDVNGGGTMYYIKAQVNSNLSKWKWIFVKIYEPPTVTTVEPVTFRGLKKMDEDYNLVVF